MKVTRFAKITVLLNCILPLALLGWDALQGHLGANPINFAIRTTGILALIFLMLTLLVTPVSRIAHWTWITPFRRMFGLCAFFHALIHFQLFFFLDRNASIEDTIAEVSKRPYLFVGMISLAIMAPLAATSTNAMIRLLGGNRWKMLHRLTYLAAIAGVMHFYMLVKADTTRPLAFAAVLAILLGYRLVGRFRSVGAATASSPAPVKKPKYWTGNLKVKSLTRETPEVQTFRLVSPTSERLPFDFLPGQYLNLTLMVDGKKVMRSYTIASSPTCTDYCELTIKREEFGVSSRHLHDTIRAGDLLNSSAPAGRFTFTGTEADSVVMIAGGVGITPLMSKIRYLTDKQWSGGIHLIFAAKTESDIIFREELKGLQERFPNLKVTFILSRVDESSWQGERGRLTPECLNRVVENITSKRIHICGPDAMMEATVAMLRGLGVPDSQIKLESFTRAEVAGTKAEAPPETTFAANGDDVGAMVTFARSGKSSSITKKQTILDVAEDLDVDIPFDCRSGVCGTCKVKLVSGRVVMDVEAALEAADRANNIILSCQAHCVDEVVVEA